MVTRAIERFIDVQVTKETPRVAVAGFGVALVITNSLLLTVTTRVKSFTTPAAVATFFGSTSEEYKAANAFFFQDPFLVNQPSEILFGRFVDASIAAVIECGDSPLSTIATWAAIADGEFSVDIDGGAVELTGIDFSSGPVTSLDDVATVIDTALGANGDCYYLGGRFNINSGTTGATSLIDVLEPIAAPSGTYIGGTGFLDGAAEKSVTVPGGSILSQGQIIETFATGLAAIEAVNNTWYAMGALLVFRDLDITEDMADAIESRRKMFLIATNDANTVVSGITSSFVYYIKNENYSRSGHAYHDNFTLYPDMAYLGKQLPKDIGSTNWAYQELPGIAEGALVNIDPVILTEDQINNGLSYNTNLYTTTLGADFMYNGTMGGGRNADKEGEYIDIIRDIDFIQARLEEGLLEMILAADIIPMSNAGISLVENQLISLLDLYGVKQGIAVEGTIVTSFPKRSEISTTDRDDRLLPDGEFSFELQGAINKVVVRGKVYV